MDVCSVLLRCTTTMLSSVNRNLFAIQHRKSSHNETLMCEKVMRCVNFCQLKHHKVRQLNALKPYHYKFPSLDEENHKNFTVQGLPSDKPYVAKAF